MEVVEAIRKTHAMSRLDRGEDVEAALKDPTGGNQRCWGRASKPHEAELDTVAPNRSSAEYLSADLHLAPVIILACVDTAARARRHVLPVGAESAARGMQAGARHDFDYGSPVRGGRVKQLLGIPNHVTTYTPIPLGHPTGRWGEANRRLIDEVSYHDRGGRVGLSAL